MSRAKSLSNDVLKHLLDEAFARHNLFSRETYSPDVVEHFCRYHWAALEALKEDGDLDAICVYSDLVTAYRGLDETTRKVITMVVSGYPSAHITRALGVNATKVAKAGYRQMSEYLCGKAAA